MHGEAFGKVNVIFLDNSLHFFAHYLRFLHLLFIDLLITFVEMRMLLISPYFFESCVHHKLIEIQWVHFEQIFYFADLTINSLLLNLIDVLVDLLDHLSGFPIYRLALRIIFSVDIVLLLFL